MGTGSILSILQHTKLLNSGSTFLNMPNCHRWVASAFMSRIQLKFAASLMKSTILRMNHKCKRKRQNPNFTAKLGLRRLGPKWLYCTDCGNYYRNKTDHKSSGRAMRASQTCNLSIEYNLRGPPSLTPKNLGLTTPR